MSSLAVVKTYSTHTTVMDCELQKQLMVSQQSIIYDVFSNEKNLDTSDIDIFVTVGSTLIKRLCCII
jgi:hypothetical protein